MIGRAEAKAAGLKHYFTGKPCKHGHVAPRQSSTGNCTECQREHQSKWYAANRDKVLARTRKWREAHSERLRAIKQRWQATNSDKAREYNQKWYAANREEAIERARKWAAANREKVNAQTQRRRARERDAECGCCTFQDFQRIYDLARLAGFEVDHIEPIALGGKHCRHNLQLLTPDDHRTKTNSDLRRIAEVKRLL